MDLNNIKYNTILSSNKQMGRAKMTKRITVSCVKVNKLILKTMQTLLKFTPNQNKFSYPLYYVN